MSQMTMVQAINHALRLELGRNERVLVLGEDVGRNGGVFRATDGLMAAFGPDRVVDMPLAESAIVGAAVGLAMGGMCPVAEIQFLGFIYEAMDQMASQAARVRFRSNGRFSAPLVVRAPFGGGVRTPEVHSDSLEALFVHTPGLYVVMPSTPYDAKGLLLTAIRTPDPVLFLEPMALYRSFRQEVPEGDYEIPLGAARVVRAGTQLTLVGWGPVVPVMEEAAERSAVSCDIIDLRWLSPIDWPCVLASVEKTGRAVVVHEAVRTGGLGAEVAATIQERAFLSLEAPVMRVTGYDTPYPVPLLEDDWLPNLERIRHAIKRTMEF
ncbi:MAG: alpha-ketoacid dehydrogenase subunit beta [Thermaerobacter sp.]|nr:alpha-ketoacid dehydrogenase subunit beta [Thermaerobacter sp.]